MEGEDPAGLTRFLIDLAKEEAGARLKNTADSQAAGINLLLSEASANEYGYTNPVSLHPSSPDKDLKTDTFPGKGRTHPSP